MNKQELLEYGLMVFNNEDEKFHRWMSKPVPALGNSYPIELLDDEEGLQLVETILHMIEFGIYS